MIYCLLIGILLLLPLTALAFGREESMEQKTIYRSVRIHAGDTLWTIAEEYKNEYQKTEHMVDEIMEANGLTTANISSGEKIIVPITILME